MADSSPQPILPDGWRTTIARALRDEPGRFVLTAFGLDLFSDAPASNEESEHHLLARLGAFLHDAPEAHMVIKRRRFADVARAAGPLPLRLPSVLPLSDPDHALWIEPMPDGAARFRCPELTRYRRAISPRLLNIIARLSRDGRGVDLWFEVHHAGADGVPMQEMVSRLERAWGVRGPVLFPTPEEFAPLSVPRTCSAPTARRRIEELQLFVDFTPLLALRKELNASLGATIGGEVTVGAMVAWGLAHQPGEGFAGQRFACTVEVPALGGQPRSVNFVSIRPSEFIDPTDRTAGFVRFVRVFNGQVAACRERRSATYRATARAARMPAWLHQAVLRVASASAAKTFGKIGLTLLRDAKVFIAPAADVGFDAGFVAIGGMNLPTTGGRRVGCVSVKGPRDTERYRAALPRLIAGFRQYI